MSQDDPSFIVSADEWKEMETCTHILLQPYIATQNLQSNECTLSDFFDSWTKMKFRLRQIKHRFAECIIKKLTDREDMLINHPVMLASIYLDPRYNFMLTEYQKQQSIIKLRDLHDRLKQNIDTEHTRANTAGDIVEDDDYAAYIYNLKENVDAQASEILNEHFDSPNIINHLQQIRKFPSVNLKTKAFDFWKTRKDENPEIYELAEMIHVIPATQVSVERAFSSLTFIFNSYRTSMKDQTLENILFVRLNHNYLEKQS